MKTLKILAILAAMALTTSMVMADDDAQEFLVVMEKMARDGKVDAQPGRPDAPGLEAGRDGGWVGLALEPAEPALLEQLGMKGGIVVMEVVPGGPADKAGVKKFDVIAVGSEGRPTGVEGFVNRIRQIKPGSELKLTVIRKGQEKHIALVVGTPPRESAGIRGEWREGHPEARPEERVKDHPEARNDAHPDVRPEGRPGMIMGRPDMRSEGRGGWDEMNREGRPGPMTGRPDMRGAGRGGMPDWGRQERPEAARIQVEADQIKQEAGRRQELLQAMASDNPLVAAQARQQWKELNERKPQTAGPMVGQDGIVIRLGEGNVQGPANPHAFAIKHGTYALPSGQPMIGQPMPGGQPMPWQPLPAPHMPGPGMPYQQAGAPAWPAMPATPTFTAAHTTNDIKIDENGRIEVRIVRDGNSLTIQFKSEDDLAARAPKLYDAYKKIMSTIR